MSEQAKRYVPSDAVRYAATRNPADYTSSREIEFDLALLRNSLNKCTEDNAGFADTLTGKIRKLEQLRTSK